MRKTSAFWTVWVPCLAALAISASAHAQGLSFRRGDANADGQLDTSDAIRLLGFLYLGSAAPPCRDSADTNDDGELSLSDAVYGLSFLHLGGPPPRAPWPACGVDPSADSLSCASYRGSCDGPRPAQSVLYLLTNQERAGVGLPPLKAQPLLEEAARLHCEDMAAMNYFSHDSLDGRDLVDRINAVGYEGIIYGENIAAGHRTPEEALAQWMASPEHRANILSPKYREIGIGQAFLETSKYQNYWGQDFGARADVHPVIINLEASSTTSRTVDLYIHGAGWALEMQVSNDPGFDGAAWQVHRSSLRWTLPAGAGWKSVHVRLRGPSGTVTSADGIFLEE